MYRFINSSISSRNDLKNDLKQVLNIDNGEYRQ